MRTTCDKTGDVGHIHQQRRIYRVGDGPEPCPVHYSGVSAESRNDDLGAMLFGQLLHLVEINEFRFSVDPVRHDVVGLSREVHRAAVGEVPAVVQSHTHDGIARLDQR